MLFYSSRTTDGREKQLLYPDLRNREGDAGSDARPPGLKDVLTGGMTVSDEVVGKQRNQGKYKAVSCCMCGAKLGMLEAPEDKGIHYCGKCRKNYLISLKDGKLTYEVFTQAR